MTRYVWLLAIVCIPMAYAGADTMWVPPNMIAGESYYGVIILDNATRSGSLALLSSGDYLVDVPESVYIKPMQNHGIFSINPLAVTDTQIMATIKGNLHVRDVEVFSESSLPGSLQIVLPANKTRTDSMMGYVILLDENGIPIISDGHMRVNLATTGGVESPASVIISNGTFYRQFYMDVRGSGTILAATKTLESDPVSIEKVQQGVEVMVGIAPDIAIPDSYVYYYVWLEKDGKPYVPPGVVRAFLHSDNGDIARFRAGITGDSGVQAAMRDGIARGILYTGGIGKATIYASIPEYGMGYDRLVVGSSTPDGVDMPEPAHIPDYREDIGDPNTMLTWIHPTVADRTSWVVSALYFANRTGYLDMTVDASGTLLPMISYNDRLMPVRADYNLIYVSSNPGLAHKDVYMMSEQSFKTNAMEFELSSSGYGTYTLLTSGQDLEPAYDIVKMSPRYEDGFQIAISAIPALNGDNQDIAMVSVFDDTGAMIDAVRTFGRDVNFTISASDHISSDIIRPTSSGSAILKGTLYHDEHITAILGGVNSADITLAPARMQTSLELLVPERVHMGEEFPFAVHETDEKGKPMRKATNLKISTPLDITIGRHMILEESDSGIITTISDAGATSAEIEAFANKMNPEVRLDRDEIRVGETARLSIYNNIDANYTLFSNYPYEQIDESTFAIEGNYEDESIISIVATRPGYETEMLSAHLKVLHIYLLDVDTTTTGGDGIHPEFKIIIGNITQSAVAPYHREFRPGPVEIRFLPQYSSGQDGYSLMHIVANGKIYNQSSIILEPQGDLAITSVYQREILVSVMGGEGSGIYRHGDKVALNAPDRNIFWILVRDVFDHWEGLDDTRHLQSQTITADNNMEITAVYVRDYTYAMILAVIPLLAGSFVVLYRRSAGMGWQMQNMTDRIIRTIKR